MLKNQYDFIDFYYYIYNCPSVPSSKTTHIIKTITFQVSEDCNLACSYCYQICKTKNKMTFDTAKKIIDKLLIDRLNPDSEYNEEKTKGIVFEFIGGEPFLEIDLIEQICDYFEEQILQYPDSSWIVNHAYSFSTNGTLYFTPKVQRYINKYREYLSISITIDGCKELHDQCRVFKGTNEGSYDIAIQAALNELRNNHNGATKITIAPVNVKYVAKGLINMLSLGFIYININCIFEKGWQLSDAQELYNQMNIVSKYLIDNNLNNKVYIAFFDLDKYKPIDNEMAKHNWCGVSSKSMLAFDYKGDMYPCIRFMESSIGHGIDPFIIGNIDHGLCKMPEEQRRYEQISSLTVENMSPQKCLDCPIGTGCAWCTGYCYQRGDIEHKTLFNCQMHKAQALACKKYYHDIKDWETYNKINIPDEMALEIISQEEWDKFNKKEE